MKKTKLILSSSLLAASALVPALVGGFATVSNIVSKKSSSNQEITVGAFVYDINTSTKEAKLLRPIDGTPGSGSSFKVIPNQCRYNTVYYNITEIADSAFENFNRFEADDEGKVKITIGKNITKIGKNAFYRCNQITSVDLGRANGLKDIGDYAFKNCKKLTGDFTISSTVTNIGMGAFENTKIQNVTNSSYIFDNLKTIGACAFKNCTELEHIVNFDNANDGKLESIGASAFYGCAKLKGDWNNSALNIPKSCQYIGALAFKGTTALAAAGLKFNDEIFWSNNGHEEVSKLFKPFRPSTTNPIQNYNEIANPAYAYWSENLTKYIPVTKITVRVDSLPSGGIFNVGATGTVVTEVEPTNATCKNPYIECSSTCVEFDEQDPRKFKIVGDSDATFTFTAGVDDGSEVEGTSSSYAIGACPVTKIEFDEDTTPARGFINTPVKFADYLKITLSESVTEPEAIAQYKQVKYSITQGSDLATIDETTGVLTPTGKGKIRVKAESVWFPGKFGLADIEVGSTLCVKEGECSGFFPEALSAQLEAENEGHPENGIIYKEFGDTLKFPSDTVEILADSFHSTNLTNKKLPACITKLDFTDATNLKTIGDYAFSGANIQYETLTGTVTLPASVETIGHGCFQYQEVTTYDLSNCSNLYGGKVYWFRGNNKCSSILLPANSPNLTKIGTMNFENTIITELTIPKTVTQFDIMAFSGTSQLTKLTFTDDSARWDYNGTKYSVIDPAANATNFKTNSSMNWTKQTTSVESLTFTYNTALNYAVVAGYNGTGSSLEIPASVWKEDGTKWYVSEIAGTGVFDGKTALTSVYLPEKLKFIGMKAFNGCSSLNSINFPSSLTTIDTNAFQYCSNLTTIDLSNTQLGTISSSCFAYDKKVTSLKLPSTLKTYLLNSCFASLGSEGSGVTLEMPASPPLANIKSAFTGANIKTIIFGEDASAIYSGCTGEVGNGLFANCTKFFVKEGASVSTYLTETLNFEKQGTSEKEGYDMYTRTL